MREELRHGGIESIQILVQAQCVKLLAAFENRLSHRRANASPFIAQQRQQSNGGAADFFWNI